MSASESAPAASDLHKTIEHLIAETVKQSRAAADTKQAELSGAMHTALAEIETGQTALRRAAEALRAVLNDTDVAPAATQVVEPDANLAAIKEDATQPVTDSAALETEMERGEHELDVIAHHASIGHASGLQAMLRARSEVKSAQTREFVNGELRLQLHLRNGLDMQAVSEWLHEHKGTVVTTTESVVEIRFAS